MKSVCSHFRWKLAILLGQSFISCTAIAAGFQINEVSPGLQGNATAGAAAAENDVSAMFINPAILATLKTRQLYVGASAIFPTIKMSNASATHTVNIPGQPPSSISASVQGSTVQNNAAISALVPNAYIGWCFRDRWHAGIALTAPFGLTTDYDNDSVVRFAAQKSSILTVNLNPALSYTVNEQWALGFGLQVQYLEARISNFDGPYTGIAAIDALIAANYPTYLKADGWGWGYNLGALYQPYKGTRLGAGYRSPIKESLSGHGRQYTSPGPTVPAPSQAFLFNAETSVITNVKTPASLTLSAAQDYKNWTLKASAQLTFWDSLNAIDIQMADAFATDSTLITKWKNSWLYALGADYRFSPCNAIRFGLAYDQTPTSDQFRGPRIPDSDRFWTTIGFTYQFTKNLSADGAYAHIFVRNQTINYLENIGSNPQTTVPLEVNNVQASYKSRIDIVALAIRYSF